MLPACHDSTLMAHDLKMLGICSTSNARINRAGSIVSSLQVLRMKIMLFAVGSNELFGGVASCRRIEPYHSTTYFSIQDT
jgi:anthranilate/para-aminobenzoate synthase component II